jgi:predicted nucleotidyltransferase
MDIENINESVTELKKILRESLGDGIELFLFGSVARSDYRSDSDIDILVLVPGEVDTALEEDIINLAYEVELKYNVVFGIIVFSQKFWSSRQARVMPFYQNLQREAQRL